MRWIKFPDGCKYTLASDIQKTAEKYGYVVPCETDGTRHPGTDCNTKMRTIIKDLGLRRTFQITEMSVVDIRVQDSELSSSFLRQLVDEGVINDSYLKIGALQLYSENAVNALLSVMLKTAVSYAPEDDVVLEYRYAVPRRGHNFEKKQNKPIASLFKK